MKKSTSKRYIALFLALVLAFSLTAFAVANGYNETPPNRDNAQALGISEDISATENTPPVSDDRFAEIISDFITAGSTDRNVQLVAIGSTAIDTMMSSVSGQSKQYALVERITDPVRLAGIKAAEGLRYDLSVRENIYILPYEVAESILAVANPIMFAGTTPIPPSPGPPPPATPTVGSVTLMGYENFYPDQYTPYTAQGPCTLQVTVSSTGSSGWTATGGVSIKSVVEVKVGYTFGVSNTTSATYTVSALAGQTAHVKVFSYFTKHSYVVTTGNLTETGYTWKPNGGLRFTVDY
ncbi:MAG: hypothetical protein LBS90_02785 [Oscillospiraceae bacterium]|nr:hypothetical protein [Oscillospiraceae bacterium]